MNGWREGGREGGSGRREMEMGGREGGREWKEGDGREGKRGMNR